MKILRCHIENFGKLSDFSIEFSANPYIIYEGNGWGKSTLAAFIKVMFYGFENERKRSTLENERKKYKPWQGGTYGGRLTFEINGKGYECIRIFGSKVKDDTFTLYDVDTNLESKDFSSDIGEEIFRIDRESFARTVFIAQNDIVTSSTDSINAKIGKLTENTDDINNYETARGNIKNLLNRYSQTRSTGKLFKMKETITGLENEVNKAGEIDDTIAELNRKIGSLAERRERLKREQSEAGNKMKRLGEYKDLQLEKNDYDKLCQELQSELKRAAEEKQYFPSRVPDEVEIREILKKSDYLSGASGRLESAALNTGETAGLKQLELQFSNGMPEERVIEEYGGKWNKFLQLRLESAEKKLIPEEEEALQRLKTRFRTGPPEEADFNRYIEMWNRRNEKKKLFQNRTETEEKPAGRITIPLAAGILMIFSGIAGFIFDKGIGTAMIAAGIMLVLFALAGKRKGRFTAAGKSDSQPGAEDGEFIRNAEAQIQQFFDQYQISYTEYNVVEKLYELKAEVRDYQTLNARRNVYIKADIEQHIAEVEDEIRTFLGAYFPGEKMTGEPYSFWLQKLEKSVLKLKELRKKRDTYEAAQADYRASYQAITGFINDLGMTVKEELPGQLREIKEHADSLRLLESKIRAKQQEKDLFEQEHDVARYQEPDAVRETQSLDQLNNRLSEIIAECGELDESISAYIKQRDSEQQNRESISEQEEALSTAREELETMKHRYNILSETMKYLEKAKESFTARYMEPINNGFEKYYGILSEQDAGHYRMNANIHITAKEHGAQRESELLSKGCQDLVGICMRMALVEAMFQEEKPFLVIDDSFVNLDDDKVKGGLRFLKKVSEEYQVIYFTCHNSRR